MFGADVDVELQLLELEASLPALHGVAMELDDCAFPLLKKITCTSELKVAMDGVNWAILVGAIPRKAGMERGDLLSVNGGIFAPQGRAINDYGSDDARVFVVGNPCNTNCLIAMHAAPDLPRDRFFAMTMLDENRARTQLAKKAGVDVTSVKNMIIWGNHSATQYPDFYNATIDGRPASIAIPDETWLKEEFVSIVQKRGAAVIAARGASSAASAANGIVDGVSSIARDARKGEAFSMCRVSEGEYGVDEGLVFSFPCHIQQGELKVIQGFSHNAYGQEKLQATLDELRMEFEMVKTLDFVA
jgi:malate dehydrogenase